MELEQVLIVDIDSDSIIRSQGMDSFNVSEWALTLCELEGYGS